MSAPADPHIATTSGRPAQPGGAGLLMLLEPLLIQVAGAGAAPVSLQVDLAADPGDAPLALSAGVDRATRTLVFATAEARRPDGRLAATVAAVFKRGDQAASASS